MLKHEYEALQDTKATPEPPFKLSMLTSQEPRTLLWGYTCDRESHHVYIEDGEIVLLVYRGRTDLDVLLHERSEEFKPELLVPDKRLYPEACDWETCVILKKMGVYLPFTTWNDDREKQQYYGERARTV